MRNIIAKMFCALCAVSSLTACVDDDYKNIVLSGDPNIEIDEIGTVEMGDKMQFTVNCSDKKGTALSTLKAELRFSDEVVADTTIRTKEAGDYDVSLTVPYLQYIPNGDVTVRLTLQNVTTSKTIVDVTAQAERPHFDNLQFIDAEGKAHDMVETDDDYNYSVKINTTESAFKGRFETADGKFVFGSDGAELALGGTANLDFQTEETGEVEVTFNTRDYTFGPYDEISTPTLVFSESDNVITRNMVQGALYVISGIVNDEWFVDNDFFASNGDGTYTFLAVDGTYTLTAYNDYKFLQVFAGTKDAPATLQADGTGAIWIIGSDCVNKPFLSSANNNGWWTGTDWDQPLAQVSPKVYQITLMVGQQLKATGVDFKFFGQPDWGTEFHAEGDGDYALSCDSEIFGIGTGKDAGGNGHDKGNIYLKDGATLKEGDTYIFTIDLTEGCANGKLIITTGPSSALQELTMADKSAVTVNVKQGTAFKFDGIVADDWTVDGDFFEKNADGTYTFKCITGRYNIVAYADYKYLQAYPINADGKPAEMQEDGTGALWIIGSDCINKPSLASTNNKGWWEGTEWNQCVAPIAPKKYRITLTVGEQLKASDINFKFFGQPGWGVEFNGKDGDYHIDSDNEWFRVNAADSDNGNIFLKDGAALNDGDTFVFTIDLTAGVKSGVLTVEKK